MPYIEGILIGAITVGSVWWLVGGIRKKQTENQNIAKESHNYYVEKKIVDSKADDLLALPDALQALRDTDIRLLNEIRMKKVSNPVLKRIQSRLREDWKIRPSETYDNLTIQTTQDVINKTVRDNELKFTKEDENTMLFMLHIAGVLDDEHIGLSERRENDESFGLVN